MGSVTKGREAGSNVGEIARWHVGCTIERRNLVASSSSEIRRMLIEAEWSKPVTLKKRKPGGLVYELDLEVLPAEPAVYLFCRRHSERVFPIYIGETLNLRSRIKSHLNSLKLMQALADAASGKRLLIYCTVKAGSPMKAKKHLKVIEKALILHSQSEGHSLFNKMGTKLPTDEIRFTGNRTSEALAPRSMLIEKALTKL